MSRTPSTLLGSRHAAGRCSAIPSTGHCVAKLRPCNAGIALAACVLALISVALAARLRPFEEHAVLEEVIEPRGRNLHGVLLDGLRARLQGAQSSSQGQSDPVIVLPGQDSSATVVPQQMSAQSAHPLVDGILAAKAQVVHPVKAAQTSVPIDAVALAAASATATSNSGGGGIQVITSNPISISNPTTNIGGTYTGALG